MKMIWPRTVVGLAAFGLAACIVAAPRPAAAQCHLRPLVELPVTLEDRRAIIDVKVNGHDARFVADTGAYFSDMDLPSAKAMDLKLGDWPYPLVSGGAAGLASEQLGVAKSLEIGKSQLHDIEFLVGGASLGQGVAGLLGQNLFQAGDVDLDLANGMIRLLQVRGCGQTALAYWVKPGDSYSVVDIFLTTIQRPHIRTYVYVNGARLEAVLDTGASETVITREAALRAGVKPGDAGVKEAGFSSGIGRSTVSRWIIPVATFRIGDEEIKNTRLAMMDSDLGGSDLLIGMDFLLSHHVYVASSQNKLYFSYVGGPVFAPPPAATPAQTAAIAEDSEAPKDAAGLARRGEAFLNRQEYAKAIADLTRSLELDPNQAAVTFARASARFFAGQIAPAQADLDRTLILEPNTVEALLLRAQIRLNAKQAGGDADLAAADKAMAPADDARLQLAKIYSVFHQPARALAQADLWVENHPDDPRLSGGLNERCWSRGLLNQDLDKAKHDCDEAIRLQPGTAAYWDSRGLVYLRLGQMDRAVQDYDQALKREPKLAWSLYCRGMAKTHQGQAKAGADDMAAAAALDPTIAKQVKADGIVL